MIRSNIADVIGKLKRAKSRIPTEIRSVMVSENYAARMRFIAGDVMDTSPTLNDAERQYIPKLLDTFMHATLAGEMQFSIHMLPLESLVQVTTEGNDFLSVITRQELIDWVAEYKIRDRRDRDRFGTDKPTEVIAERVGWAVQSDPNPWLNSTNPTGLRMVTGLTRLPPHKIAAVLREVMEAWVAYIRETLPRLMQQKLGESVR
jgi:hypothetical protein